ncbi:DeoR/GlpR family DNA-binding transcription regulator [Barrientosiimonas marina]|uniref:DeoR/GlpR family DNA-binding transcription regulator n=1 Tax=Lentibacillus kimchii TaxID=1542911 RepID=A0ABW2UYN7_9BACI
MLNEERHQLILDQLNQHQILKSQYLMDAIGCSESTIRRDLDHLEAEGKLIRIHGGAKRAYQLDTEQTTKEKSFKNVQNKDMIGQKAAGLIEHRDVIYIDAGTTTLAILPYVTDQSITVVTNGIQHASMLADQGIETFLTGGRIKHDTKAMIGSQSLHDLSYYRFDKAFLGMNGIDSAFGCTTPDPEEAVLKQTAHKQAAITFLLADQSKWDKISFTKVCDLDAITVITDRLNEHLNHYREKTNIMEAVQ